jgi:hypothetical protein
MLVTNSLKIGNNLLGHVQGSDPSHYVDNGFCSEAWNCRATDMLYGGNAASKAILEFTYGNPVSLNPSRIIRN